MPEVAVRKRLSSVEEIFHEGGPRSTPPLRRAVALAVIRNPYAGAYVPDIAGFMDDLKPLGLEMAKSLVQALGGYAQTVEGYGKGAIVGSAGEIEHGLADAPRADEILLALVMTTGPRIHARVGGLKASEIKGEDGLR